MDYSGLYAKRIHELCTQRGITINKLATLSGLRQSTIDNIARGVSKNPKIKTLHRICQHVQYDAERIFGLSRAERLLV